MAETTSKLGLVKPTEDEYYDVADFNGNMDKIDALTHIVKSGKVTSKFMKPGDSATQGGTVNWIYKKFDDGTFECKGKLTVNNLIANETTAAGLFRSKTMVVYYPTITGIQEVMYRNYSVRNGSGDDNTSTYNFISDVSDIGGSLTSTAVRVYCAAKETKNMAKNIYLEFAGTWK